MTTTLTAPAATTLRAHIEADRLVDRSVVTLLAILDEDAGPVPAGTVMNAHMTCPPGPSCVTLTIPRDDYLLLADVEDGKKRTVTTTDTRTETRWKVTRDLTTTRRDPVPGVGHWSARPARDDAPAAAPGALDGPGHYARAAQLLADAHPEDATPNRGRVDSMIAAAAVHARLAEVAASFAPRGLTPRADWAAVL